MAGSLGRVILEAITQMAEHWTRWGSKLPATFKNLSYIYEVEYCSTMKRNETGSFVEMWMDLETAIQSEVSQKEKNKHCVLMLDVELRKMV